MKHTQPIIDDCEICGTHARLYPAPKGVPTDQSAYSLKYDGRVPPRTWMCAGCCQDDTQICDSLRRSKK